MSHMTVTFTQLKLNIQPEYCNAEEVITVLRELEATGAGNVLNIDAQIHVTGSNIEIIKAKLQALEKLGVLSNYKHNDLLNRIESFERLYLK